MATENETMDSLIRRGKFKSGLPLPKSGTNISKFGYQETKVPPLILPSIEDRRNSEMCVSSTHVGERVSISGTKFGTLKFYGITSFATGCWCGIELDDPVGKNSGEIDGVEYFECRENHGIFAPPSKVQLIVETPKDIFESGDSKSNVVAFNKFVVNESGENFAIPKSKLMAPKVYPKNLPPVTRQVNNSSFVVSSNDPNTTRILSKESTVEMEKTQNGGLDVTFDKPKMIQNDTFCKDKFEKILNETFDKENVEADKLYALPEIEEKIVNETFDKENFEVDKLYALPEIEEKIVNETFDTENFEVDKLYALPEIEGKIVNETYDKENFEVDKLCALTEIEENFEKKLDESDKMESESNDGRKSSFEIDKFDFESFDCDDSLGILTPNQMVDSMFGDSLLKTPSFENVLELDDESIEKANFDQPEPDKSQLAITSTPVLEKETQAVPIPDIWTVPTPKIRQNESFFYLSQFDKSTLETPYSKLLGRTKMELASISPISDFSHNETIIKAFDTKIEIPRDSDNSDTSGASLKHLNLVADNLSKDVINETLQNIQQPNVLQMAPQTDILISKMSNFSEVLESKKERTMSSLTMSVTSIDTGYQGDAECDAPSGAQSAAITPVEDHRKFDGIDSKDLLLAISLGGDIGTYNNNNFLRHPKTDIGSDSDFCSDMGTSWTESEVENEEKGRGRAARVIDGTLYYYNDDNDDKNNHVMRNIVIENGDKSEQDQARSSDSSTLEETLTEKLTPTSDITTIVDNKTNINSTAIIVAPEVTSNGEGGNVESMECQGDNIPEAKVGETSLPDKKMSGKGRKRNETPTKKFKSPKKNVMSKIKAMIEATTCKSNVNGLEDVEANCNEARMESTKKVSRTPKKNSKWDAVMSKIAAGQAEEKAKGKSKREIRSRVNTNLSGAKAAVGEIRSKNTSGRTNAGHGRLVKRDSTLSELSENVSEYDNFHSNRSSRSDVSAGKRKPRTTRISSERATSPSQLSDISTMSAASHLSSFSQTSHRASTSLRKNRKDIRVQNQIEKDLIDRPKTRISANVLKNNQKNIANSPIKKPPIAVLAAKKEQSSPLANGVSQRTTNTSSPKPKISNATTAKKSNLSNTIGLTSTNSRLAPSGRVTNKTVPANQVQLSAKAEQNRVRSLKAAPVNKSGHHQPDLLNLSVATAETEADKEIRRLETLCESHGKEINRLKSLLEQRTMGFEAFTIFAKYMIEDLDAFTHPSTIKDFHHVRRSLDACKFDLDRAILEKENLQAKNADLIAAHQNELDKLRQGHENDVAAMKEMIVKNYQEDIQKLEDDFNEAELMLKEQHEEELFELTQTNEHIYHDKLFEKVKELRTEHTLQINTIETEYDLKVEELTKDYNSINYNLEQQLLLMNSKCSDLHRQKKEYEDALLKDNNYKLQIAAGKITDLQKEIESLKSVIELRNTEIHELRMVSNKVTKLEEELYRSEEKIKLLSTKTEDLQAQVDIKNSKERQLSNEQQLLREWFQKESQINKRLSMENEELQWKLAQSMEAPSLTALFENSPNASVETNHYMSTSTPITIGASDGDEHRSPRCKRSMPFGATKSIPSQRSPYFNRDERVRHHRQRFSISESENRHDLSPASRYRRAQSLSWTVGLKPEDCHFKSDEIDASFNDSPSVEFESQTDKSSETEKKLDEVENTIKLNSTKPDIITPLIVETTTNSQILMKRATLERRNSVSPDARVPSLITVQYLDEQRSNRSKRERRSSLGSLKWGEDSSLMSRSTRSLSSPHDYHKKTPRNSPIKTKNSIKKEPENSSKDEKLIKSSDEIDFRLEEEIIDKKEENKMIESQESVNQRSMTDSEDFSAPLTISLKSDDRMSSCESSPLPGEPSQSSRSEDSSPRASPHFRSKMAENSLCDYTMSPRMSAGECMVMDDNKTNDETVATSDVLLRRTFPQFYAKSNCSSARESSREDNQGTPESGSMAILPTDSTNIDLSWSEDEIPSESEV